MLTHVMLTRVMLTHVMLTHVMLTHVMLSHVTPCQQEPGQLREARGARAAAQGVRVRGAKRTQGSAAVESPASLVRGRPSESTGLASTAAVRAGFAWRHRVMQRQHAAGLGGWQGGGRAVAGRWQGVAGWWQGGDRAVTGRWRGGGRTAGACLRAARQAFSTREHGVDRLVEVRGVCAPRRTDGYRARCQSIHADLHRECDHRIWSHVGHCNGRWHG